MTRRNRIKGKRKIKRWRKATIAYNKIMQLKASYKRDINHNKRIIMCYLHKIKLVRESKGKNTLNGIPKSFLFDNL